MKKILISLVIFLCVSLFSIDINDEWKAKTNKFRLEQLAKDLLNADYNQLKSIAMSLGLEEQTSAQAYRNVIAKYYNINLIETKSEKRGSKIVLERAGELKTIKFTEDDEECLHILGRVKLILYNKDSENKETSRIIEADEVNINTKTKEISGIGNVHFKDDKLEFTGDQFYYNYDLNRGALIKGRTQLIKGGESGLDGAFFNGEKVIQTGPDDVTLYNGSLTTCPEINPHYYLRVSRLWLSEKGEWGILNGVVYIGQIPFFYFPIYYHPKNFFINPAFGFKSREGWYFNSTYYILGEKETADSSQSKTGESTAVISINQLIDKRRFDSKDPTKVKSLTYSDIFKFLSKFYDSNEFFKKYPKFRVYPKMDSNAMDMTWNLFLDMYTNLGFYWGTYFYIKANYTDFPFKFKVLSDYAFSRIIWKDPDSSVYYPYDPANKASTDIKGNNYFDFSKNPLKFRTSQWAKFSGQLFKSYINFSYDLQLDYATDRTFYIDFYNRRLDFTYIDALADLISYNLMTKSKDITSFKTTGISNLNQDTDKVSNLDIKKTYTSFILSLLRYPDIFGLNIISLLDIRLDNAIELIATEISQIKKTDVEDPREVRYLLYSFYFPTDPNKEDSNLINIKGTLLDYDAFVNMPVKIETYKRNKTTNIGGDAALMNDLYIHVNNIKMKDASTDTTVIDYKLLLPVYSRKITISQINVNLGGYKYEKVISDDVLEVQKNAIEKDKEDKKTVLSSNIELIKVDPYQDLKYDIIKPIEFKIYYDFKEKLANKFFFDTDTTNTNRYNQYDTLELIANNPGQNMLDDILQRFNIYNRLSFSLNGPFNIMKFSGNPLFGFNPQFVIEHKKSYDDISIYENYQLAVNDSISSRDSKIGSLLIDDYSKTNMIIKYQDQMVNDLSFGVYMIKGTQIKTDMSFIIFSYNQLSERNFILLNELNTKSRSVRLSNTGDFSNYYYNGSYNEVDPIYYYSMVNYERIEKLETTFTLNFNFFEEKNPHQLSMGVSPLIKWVIPKTNLDELKADLWEKEANDIDYNLDTVLKPEALLYLSYREKEGNNKNLNDEIQKFFSAQNFWGGPKNFRYMFDNVTYNTKYSYTPMNNFKAVNIENNLIFKLYNIGEFSNIDPDDITLGIYPDDKLTVSFLNSIINYNMSIEFIRKLNPYKENVNNLSIEKKRLDGNNIMAMDNKHTLSLKIPGTIFDTKLPSGDWLNFSFSTLFKWDRTIPAWNDTYKYNSYFYLDSQSLSLYLLMNIVQFDLTFKKYNFQDLGYGLELNNGSIKIGYRITEIPIFWSYFKLILEPRLSYTFYVKHPPYYDTTNLNYDDSSLKEYSTEYYENNNLKFSFTAELQIAASTKYNTSIAFTVISENKKMYRYYQNDGINLFFTDLADSFNFSDISARRRSPFNLQLIKVTLNHSICDWTLSFTYIGAPKLSLVQGTDTTRGRYNWENYFSFAITWGIDTKNQLMNLFNKTKVNAVYNYEKNSKWMGEWQQPDISLDTNEQNTTDTTDTTTTQ